MNPTLQYQQAIKTMKNTTPGTPEHTEAWRTAEQAKNQNGGMPPVGHTPGPWEANANTVWRGGHEIVCHPLNSPRSIADARLIAAAPELLEALEQVMPLVARYVKLTTEGAASYIVARTAIAKAKGQQP